MYLKAQKEVDAVFGEKEELDFDDITKLVYLETVLREALRMNPPVNATSRVCTKDKVVIEGLHIPQGAIPFIPQVALHRDPRYWEEPKSFNPDRFSAAERSKMKPFSFMPFMAGPRNCIGKNFAMLEMKVMISRFLREFELENPNPEVTELITHGTSITTRPLNGVPVRVLPRLRS